MARKVIINTSSLNRKGFRVLTSGIDLTQYQKNPILLYMHFRPYRGTEDEIKPIGTVENVTIEGDNLVGELKFSQVYPFAQEVEKMWDEGTLKMVSAGLVPLEWSDDAAYLLPGQTRFTLSKCRLEETSVADIGANDDALAIKNNTTGEMIQLKENADINFIPLLNKPDGSTNENAGQNLNTKQMDEKILLVLGLSSGAKAEDVINAITALKNERDTLQLRAIETDVDAAIGKRQILAEKRNSFIELGQKAGIETLRNTLSGIPAAPSATQLINRGTGANVPADKKWGDMTEKELQTLRSDEPGVYKQLYTAEYGFAPVLK